MMHCNEDLNIKVVDKQADMTPVQWVFFMKGYPVYQQKLKDEMDKQQNKGKRVGGSYNLGNKAKGIGR